MITTTTNNSTSTAAAVAATTTTETTNKIRNTKTTTVLSSPIPRAQSPLTQRKTRSLKTLPTGMSCSAVIEHNIKNNNNNNNNNNSNNNCNNNSTVTKSNKTNETPTEELKLNEFLDFMKLSRQVNEMISADNLKKKEQQNLQHQQPQSMNIKTNRTNITTATRTSKSTPQTDFVLDFKRLAENPVVNSLLHNKNKNQNHCHCHNKECGSRGSAETKQKNEPDTICGGAGTAGTTAAAQTTRRRSSTGSSSIYNFPQLASGARISGGNCSGLAGGLHPKLTEKLDYVLNEGVLDSVLPFICPVPVPTPPRLIKRVIKQQNLTKATTASDSNAMDNSTENNAATAQSPEIEKQTSIITAGKTTTVTLTTTATPTTTTTTMVMNTCGDSGVNGIRKLLSPKFNISRIKQKFEKKEPEVIIHVCDEVKNTTRDFSCPQNLLISKMGYFADITAGQRLEDMDISVHCDIQIFDWLIKWVKQEGKYDRGVAANAIESGPLLDAGNVVPILVSATFLQMEPLMLDCLSFCHARLGEVVRAAANLSCLNDAIITRLAAMFTNMELELVRDKKERVTPRLWTKFIQSLCEPEPETLRGHYYSLSGLFRCARCGKCITNTMQTYISCLNNNMRLNRWGQLVSHHVRDPNWDINAYITQLYKELKSWRRVYWNLWGHCHFLYCSTCERHFPVYQMLWCRYHPESPHYLGPVSEGRIAGPAGRYPCCGQQAFRYETLQGPNGCQYREHNVFIEADRERMIFSIAQYVGETEGHALYEVPTKRMRELISCDVEANWLGLTLSPQRRRNGLLPVMDGEEIRTEVRHRSNKSLNGDSSSDDSESSGDDGDNCYSNNKKYDGYSDGGASNSRNGYSTSSDGCESEYSARKYQRKKNRRKQRNEIAGRFWSGELSARSNQDHQREYEEKVMKQVVVMMTKKNASEQSLGQSSVAVSGSYYRLETEWRDHIKQRVTNTFANVPSIGCISAPNSNTNLIVTLHSNHALTSNSSNVCLPVATISSTTLTSTNKRFNCK